MVLVIAEPSSRDRAQPANIMACLRPSNARSPRSGNRSVACGVGDRFCANIAALNLILPRTYARHGMHIVWVIIIGFVAGIIARFLAPGSNNPAGFILTTLLGIAGTFVATFIWAGGRSAGTGLIRVLA